MAIIYVDISVDTGIGDKSGSDVDNYAGFWDVFVADGLSIEFISSAVNEYRLRGSRDLSADYQQFNSENDYESYLVAWDMETYGPWRMLFDGSDSNSGAEIINLLAKDGIIATKPLESGEDGLRLVYHPDAAYPTTCSNMVFLTGYWLNVFNTGTINFKGCNFIARDEASTNYGIDISNSSATQNYRDTVFSTSYGLNNGDSDYFFTDHCAMKFTSSPFGTNTDAQTNLIAPTWPAWDAPKEDWNLNTLLSAVTTPPQPGVPPYTGYATDLWGNARIGIGTGFSGTVPTTSTTLPPDPLDPLAFNKRKSHGPVITDGGPGGRTLSGNGHEMSDYHAPWWLQ